MPITPASRRALDTYNAKCGTIQIRPIQDVVDDIKAAAAAAGQSLQKYILLSVRDRMRAEGFYPTSSNWPDNSDRIIYKYCLVAKFADGSRLRFPGVTMDACRAAISAAEAVHGTAVSAEGVTDETYTAGLRTE